MRRTILQALTAACLLFSVLGSAQTPEKPNFSGRWRMIKAKSDFSGFKSPDIITRSIEQHGAIMNVHTVQTAAQKTSIADVSYSIDGTPTQNVINGRDAESKTFWDGDVLVVRTMMKTAKGDDELIQDRWALSDDKQTLTISSHIETEKGTADLTLVCGRESAK
jgi:hypothetical protein